jgi:Zn-dependent protease with chaperone function
MDAWWSTWARSSGNERRVARRHRPARIGKHTGMIQILPIILVAAVMAVDGGVRPLAADWAVPAGWIIAWMWLTPASLLLLAWLGIRVCEARLRRGRMPGPLVAADRIMRAARWFIAVNQVACVLLVDGLAAVRAMTGDLILIDELITLLPALLALGATWWIYFPIENRLVQATLIRRLDEGKPIYPIQSRGQYLLLQVRMHMLLVLAPVLVIAGISEVIDSVWVRWDFGPAGAREALTIIAAAGVFLFAPLLARLVLDVQRLPGGELRESLEEVCRRHGVRVRDLLLWRTNGSMINAAVMGVVARLRYVLITDALLEMLRRDQVCAVMAHEVGHVRRHHMVWLIICLMACLLLATHLVSWPLHMGAVQGFWPDAWNEPLAIAAAVLQLLLALMVFGWVCRRFERQADTFAVQHLSTAEGAHGHQAITPQAVHSLRSALGAISFLNTVDPSRHSWRHGSIRWRQRYLDSLVGLPVRQLPIDRMIRRLKWASALIIALGAAYQVWAHRWETDTTRAREKISMDLTSIVSEAP